MQLLDLVRIFTHSFAAQPISLIYRSVADGIIKYWNNSTLNKNRKEKKNITQMLQISIQVSIDASFFQKSIFTRMGWRFSKKKSGKFLMNIVVVWHVLLNLYGLEKVCVCYKLITPGKRQKKLQLVMLNKFKELMYLLFVKILAKTWLMTVTLLTKCHGMCVCNATYNGMHLDACAAFSYKTMSQILYFMVWRRWCCW